MKKFFKILKTEDMKNELEEILNRKKNLQIIITRVEHCLSKPKIHGGRNSLPSSNSSHFQ